MYTAMAAENLAKLARLRRLLRLWAFWSDCDGITQRATLRVTRIHACCMNRFFQTHGLSHQASLGVEDFYRKIKNLHRRYLTSSLVVVGSHMLRSQKKILAARLPCNTPQKYRVYLIGIVYYN